MLDFLKRKKDGQSDEAAAAEMPSQPAEHDSEASDRQSFQVPPEHPLTPRLLALAAAMQGKRRELASIQADLEGEAAPIAEEIELLEAAEQRAAGQLVAAEADGFATFSRLDDLAAQRDALSGDVSRRIAALQQQIDDLREWEVRRRGDLERAAIELRGAADRHQDAIAVSKEVVAEAQGRVEAARARFERLLTTSTGRRLETAIARIEEQMRKIIGRNPGARHWQLEPLIAHEANVLGLAEQRDAAVKAFGTKEFGEAWAAASGDVGGRFDDERAAAQEARQILGRLGVECRDIRIIAIIRHRKPIVLRAGGLTREGRQRCFDSIMARARPTAKEDAA